ncbi:MAG: hypothetical protein OSA98_07005 [Rubripirellula sp.]|nr:hypothetical protein [Rubripirellula sp.]
MRQLTSSFLLLTILFVPLYAISKAQEPIPLKSKSSKTQDLKIVPLVTLKPGETKELIFSTWCTVGVTRSGGFSLAEMIGGEPQFTQSKLQGNRSYNKGGVTISVPDFDEGKKFASSSTYSLLKRNNLDAFRVTIAAASTAKSGLLEMHLLDATCAGHCKTDFRVLVVEQ